MQRVSCTKRTGHCKGFMPSPMPPFFHFNDTSFGDGIVGGPMHSVNEGSHLTASVAIRILGGERPGDIKVPATGFAVPKFDWREMRRWGISESRLMPGSEIYFREPTVWEQYRAQILTVCAVILLPVCTHLLAVLPEGASSFLISRYAPIDASHPRDLASQLGQTGHASGCPGGHNGADGRLPLEL